ncbi:MAG TPA: hypothetical protein VK927_08905, partial [Adhaeribacter sp.]|nr:hypothetical protein [Adhaeribacter sp.]
MKKIKLALFLLLIPYLSLAQVPSCSTTVSTFPYFQDFEAGAGGWTSGGTNSSWALGPPSNNPPSNKLVITSAASGMNCWITAQATAYNSDENSYVASPCFNFSNLAMPAIELKIWWNSEYGFDGTVLQSSTDGGLTWQNVGKHGDPYNWFNVNNIGSMPGGQQLTMHGWSGRDGSSPGNGSNGYVLARHKLDGLGGQ